MTIPTTQEPIVGFKWRRTWASLPIDEKIRIKTVQLANQDDPETRHVMRVLACHGRDMARRCRVRAKVVGWICHERGLA
jgi:hypothetical protein